MFRELNTLINNELPEQDLDNFSVIIGSNPSQGARSPILWNKVYKEEKYWNDPNFVEDYIKEFCNLVGGSISSLAKKEQNELGKSIPMVLTGFDEIYFPVNKILSEMVYEWEFTKGHIKFMTRMEISSLNIEEIFKLFEDAQDAEEVQDLTFL